MHPCAVVDRGAPAPGHFPCARGRGVVRSGGCGPPGLPCGPFTRPPLRTHSRSCAVIVCFSFFFLLFFFCCGANPVWSFNVMAGRRAAPRGARRAPAPCTHAMAVICAAGRAGAAWFHCFRRLLPAGAPRASAFFTPCSLLRICRMYKIKKRKTEALILFSFFFLFSRRSCRLLLLLSLFSLFFSLFSLFF